MSFAFSIGRRVGCTCCLRLDRSKELLRRQLNPYAGASFTDFLDHDSSEVDVIRMISQVFVDRLTNLLCR